MRKDNVESNSLSLTKSRPHIHHRRTRIWSDANLAKHPAYIIRTNYIADSHKHYAKHRLRKVTWHSSNRHVRCHPVSRFTPFPTLRRPIHPTRQAGSRESQERARRASGRQSAVDARRGTTCAPGFNVFVWHIYIYIITLNFFFTPIIRNLNNTRSFSDYYLP